MRRIFSIEIVSKSFADKGSCALLSDGGDGEKAVYDEIDHRCFGVEDGASRYTRMARRARDFVRRRNPLLLPTLDAILRNGNDRRESIFELAKSLKPKKRKWAAAEKRYYRSRAKLLNLFGG